MLKVEDAIHNIEFDASQVMVGTLFDVYPGKSTPIAGGKTRKVAVKLGRKPEDKSALQHEHDVLCALWARVHADPDKYGFFGWTLPEPMGFYDYATSEGVLPVAVVKWVRGRTAKSIRQKFPAGIPPVQVAWMLTRLLTTIAASHKFGFIHGAILPSNLMVDWDNTKRHRYAKVLDWTAAVKKGEPFLRILPEDARYYPPEAFQGGVATPASDIYMFGQTANYLLGGDLKTRKVPKSVPDPLRGVIQSCLIPNPARRPTNASTLLFDVLRPALARTWGSPKYTPFILP